jgi:hypothetical protein
MYQTAPTVYEGEGGVLPADGRMLPECRYYGDITLKKAAVRLCYRIFFDLAEMSTASFISNLVLYIILSSTISSYNAVTKVIALRNMF